MSDHFHEISTALDALIAEAKAQPPVTAPTPERRVGEDEGDVFGVGATVERTVLPNASLELDRLRAANALLTAEVERLRGLVKEGYEEGRSSQDYRWEDSNTCYDLEHPAALSLPTPAPEATE